MIVLSCGHSVADFDHTYHIMTRSLNRKGERAIEYQTVCGACEDSYRQSGDIFDTETQAQEWLSQENL